MPDISLKVVVCGDFAVGKTSLVRSFLSDEMNALEGYKPTIGVDIGRKALEIGSKKIILRIWDLSGQKTFKQARNQFYKRSDGCILVFDVTRRNSFEHLTSWLEEMWEQTGKIPVILVGNKIDLKTDDVEIISPKEIEALALQISKLTGKKTPYVEISATRQINNHEPFILLGQQLI